MAVSLKWKMFDNTHFNAEYDGYIVDVRPGGGIGGYCKWTIVKDGELIDSYLSHHSAPKGELQGKVAAERELNKILTSKLTNGK